MAKPQAGRECHEKKTHLMYIKIKSEIFASSYDRVANTEYPPAIHNQQTGENIETITVRQWTTGRAEL